jgi:hypothetical protein
MAMLARAPTAFLERVPWQGVVKESAVLGRVTSDEK